MLQTFECTDLSAANTAPRTVDEIADQRERISVTLKALTGRKQELDRMLRSELDKKGEVVAGGRRYVIRNVQQRSYPVVDTIGRVSAATGARLPDVAEQVATISNTKLNAYIKGLDLPRSKAGMLTLELQASAKTSYAAQIIGSDAA